MMNHSSSPAPFRKSLEARTLLDKTRVTMLSLLLGSTVMGLMFLIPSETSPGADTSLDFPYTEENRRWTYFHT